MNVRKFLTNPKRSFWFETTLIQDPGIAYQYLRVSFLFDVFMFMCSIAGILAIFITKTDFIPYYVVACAAFVYYLTNMLSITYYIGLFIENYHFKYKLLSIYRDDESRRETIDSIVNELPEEYKGLYKEQFKNLLKRVQNDNIGND